MVWFWEQILQLLNNQVQLINKLREMVISVFVFYALFRTIIGCTNKEEQVNVKINFQRNEPKGWTR